MLTISRIRRARLSTDTWLLLVALLILAFSLAIAISDEPYHVDELRQVGHYPGTPGTLVAGSYAQEQPPLHYLLGGLTYRLLGSSDSALRLPDTILAWMAALMLAILLRLSGMPRGAWAVVSKETAEYQADGLNSSVSCSTNTWATSWPATPRPSQSWA